MSRLLTFRKPHHPDRHRRWPLMLVTCYGLPRTIWVRGLAVCWRGVVYGLAIAPRYRGTA